MRRIEWAGRTPPRRVPTPSLTLARTPRGARSGDPPPASPADLVALQELPGDDDLLDLTGAFADQQKRRVPVQALDGELGRVAVPTMNPQGVRHDLVAGLRAEILRHPRLEVAAHAGGLRAGCLHEHQPGRLQLRAHVGDLLLDHLVLGDRLTERRA